MVHSLTLLPVFIMFLCLEENVISQFSAPESYYLFPVIMYSKVLCSLHCCTLGGLSLQQKSDRYHIFRQFYFVLAALKCDP